MDIFPDFTACCRNILMHGFSTLAMFFFKSVRKIIFFYTGINKNLVPYSQVIPSIFTCERLYESTTWSAFRAFTTIVWGIEQDKIILPCFTISISCQIKFESTGDLTNVKIFFLSKDFIIHQRDIHFGIKSSICIIIHSFSSKVS